MTDPEITAEAEAELRESFDGLSARWEDGEVPCYKTIKDLRLEAAIWRRHGQTEFADLLDSWADDPPPDPGPHARGGRALGRRLVAAIGRKLHP